MYVYLSEIEGVMQVAGLWVQASKLFVSGVKIMLKW